jgi:hypothetical protein
MASHQTPFQIFDQHRFFDVVHSLKFAKKTARPHFLKNRPSAAFVAVPLSDPSF